MWSRNSYPAGPDFSLKLLSSAVVQQALDLRWSPWASVGERPAATHFFLKIGQWNLYTYCTWFHVQKHLDEKVSFVPKGFFFVTSVLVTIVVYHHIGMSLPPWCNWGRGHLPSYLFYLRLLPFSAPVHRWTGRCICFSGIFYDSFSSRAWPSSPVALELLTDGTGGI